MMSPSPGVLSPLTAYDECCAGHFAGRGQWSVAFTRLLKFRNYGLWPHHGLGSVSGSRCAVPAPWEAVSGLSSFCRQCWERAQGSSPQEGPSHHGKGSSSRQLTGALTAPRVSRERGRKRGHPSLFPPNPEPSGTPRLAHTFTTSLPYWGGVGWGGGDETHDSSCPRGRAHLAPHIPILKTLGLRMVGGTKKTWSSFLVTPHKASPSPPCPHGLVAARPVQLSPLRKRP